MNAEFDIAAGIKVGVRNAQGVLDRIVFLVEFPGPTRPMNPVRRESIYLRKSEARAIASALMGAAAEL